MLLWSVTVVISGTLQSAVHAADVLIVEGDYLATRQPRERAGMQSYIKNVQSALNLAGIEWEMTKDSAVEKEGALEGRRVAIFPHNGTLPEGEIAAIERFMEAGGKVILFYSLGGSLAARIGVKDTGFVGGEENRDKFAVVRFDAPEVVGLPASMTQNSWNIHSFTPLEGGARVIGTWVDKQGTDTGLAAVALGDEGAIMNHVLLNGGPEAARFLIAIIGHWFPEVWAAAVERALAQSEKWGRFECARDLEAFIKGLGDPPNVREMQAALAQAEKARQHARLLAEKREWPEALDTIASMPDILGPAYAKLYPPRQGEMRAVWVHSPFNVADWDVACRHLRQCGFNAVIVNFCNAALSYYPSRYLRQHDRARKEGDQILRVLKACRENGIELHVWRVNWNTGGDKQRVEQIQAAGLNAVASNGTPGAWLCPSHPENKQHEIDTMLEIVKNYDVDGIHFDYIRYESGQYCYCDYCRKCFEERIGRQVASWPLDVAEGELREPWLQYRRDQIDAVVKEVSERAHALKPTIKVSAAVFGEWPASRISIGQDAKLWVDKGWLDFVCPMNYTNDTNYLRRLTEAQVQAVDGQCPLYIGIGAWRHPSVATLVDQLQSVRELGADGFVLFSYESGQTQNFLSLIGKGQTRGKTYTPHHAPRVSLVLPESLLEGQGRTYPAGTTIEASIELSVQNHRPQPFQLVRGTAWLETTEGKRLRRLGKLRTRDRATYSLSLTIPEGLTRLTLYGTATLAGGERVPWVYRGPRLRGIAEAEVEAIKAASEPPKIEGKGIKVGVTTEGYGTRAMIEALNAEPDIIAFELNRLTPEFLAVCDVVILAQFRSVAEANMALLKPFVEWVRTGGRAMLMHDAVGYRQHPVLFPEIGRGKATAETRLVESSLPNLQGVFKHSYYDHIRLASGAEAEVIAREPEAEGGEAVVVRGIVGQGRVVLNGMVTGLTDGDKELAPTGGELKLLLAAVRWLAEGTTLP
ncbi:MAG: glycoside hydrolase family 10 protein [Candidatus Zipacnadales bacterium]